MKEAVKTIGLTKQYRNVTAVNGLDLCVYQGELFSLLGVNGAGKSTAIRMLSCLTPPTSGEAFLEGKSILTEAAAVKAIIGVSPQETAVAPNLSVRENLALMCGMYGFSKEQRAAKIDTLCKEFDLGSVMERRAAKLSGGWQRRLSIAMALVGDPKLLFLDEPTLGLDVIARSELWDTVRALKGKTTVILTTHYMEEAEALSDRVGIMKSGSLIAIGTVAELKQQAKADRFEEAFVKLIKEARV